mgnify:CR=1 FL=1
MAQFIGLPVAIGQADFVSSSTAVHAIGTRAISKDGRKFVYVKAGAADLVAGNVLQSPAIVALHLANTPPAVAIGDTSFSYTPGATLGTVDQYADGFLQVDTTPGNGYTYVIDGHAAFASATAFTLRLKDPIQVALTTSSRVGLIANQYNGVIQMPVTTATGALVGIATYVIVASQYGWIATSGTFSTLIAGTPALGAMVMAPGAVAGAAEVVVAVGTLIVAQIVGHMAQVGVAGKNNFVHVRIS